MEKCLENEIRTMAIATLFFSKFINFHQINECISDDEKRIKKLSYWFNEDFNVVFDYYMNFMDNKNIKYMNRIFR